MAENDTVFFSPTIAKIAASHFEEHLCRKYGFGTCRVEVEGSGLIVHTCLGNDKAMPGLLNGGNVQWGGIPFRVVYVEKLDQSNGVGEIEEDLIIVSKDLAKDIMRFLHIIGDKEHWIECPMLCEDGGPDKILLEKVSILKKGDLSIQAKSLDLFKRLVESWSRHNGSD